MKMTEIKTSHNFKPGDRVWNIGLRGVIVHDNNTPAGLVAIDYGDDLPIFYVNPFLLELVDGATDARS
jgi:hypothetical protein